LCFGNKIHPYNECTSIDFSLKEFQDDEFTLPPTVIGKFSKLERLALRCVDSAYLIEALASLKNARALDSL